ncbi:MAG: cytochrome b561 domain-containing protein [Rhodospirillaceae bacterium]
MNFGKVTIPTEVYLDFLGETIPIHWDNHAYLMVFVWFVMVPIGVLVIRFGKPEPTEKGIETKISITNPKWWWFSVHKYGLYVAVGLAILGGAVAYTVSQGFSGSLHAFFGTATLVLGVLQVVTSWFRGRHGGKYYYTATPGQPETYWGDHYNFTTRRRLFEAYHKTAGYAAGFMAFGAVGSGLMQFPLPNLAITVFALIAVFVVAWMVLQYKGKQHDGYRAVHGYGLEHPYNKMREKL